VQSKAYLRFEDNSFYQQNAIYSDDCINLQLLPVFSKRILLIRPYPGTNYSNYNLEQVDAVIHDLYHSGTACVSEQWGENYSLVKFIQKCTEKNINLYMAPAIKRSDTYQSTLSLIEQSAKMIWNMSLESAYVKLLLAYGNFKDNDSIISFLEKDIAFEMLAS
jgi:L-asparaginase